MQKTYFLAALLLFSWACGNSSQTTTDTSTENGTSAVVTDFQATGDSIANAAQKAFVGALMKAINQQGAAGAVAFCNVHALPIADSLSQRYNCAIQRISDRYRNPADKPDAADSAVIADYQAQKAAGTALAARLLEQDNQVIYYKPIMLGMPACLQCHGDPQTDIAAPTLAAIREKYPNDLAIGYKQGDLRGLWKITFRK
ncbi:Tll0287-like domain-containing protein [Rhodoflexus sp.]